MIRQLFGLILSGSVAWGAIASENNRSPVEYNGTLVNLACVIDEDIPELVEMGPIADRTLYLFGVSAPKFFTLTLKNCDATLANSVTITLNGMPGSVTKEGYLAFDGGSTAQGAVIGIADDRLTRGRIQMGSPLPKQPVVNGTMTIPLYVYVVGVPEAIQNNALVPGPFTATLYYQVEFQ